MKNVNNGSIDSTLDYFRQGLLLIRTYPVIFVVSLAFFLTDILHMLIPNFLLQSIFSVMSVLLLPVSIGYLFSIPKLLDLAQEKKLNVHTGLATVKDITRRIFLPAVLGVVLFSIPLLTIYTIYGLGLVSLFTEGRPLPAALPPVYQIALSIATVAMSVGLNLLFFTFTPVVYSLDTLGIKDSLRKNILLLKTHKRFTLAVFFLNLLMLSISPIATFIQRNTAAPLGNSLSLIVSQLIFLLILASAYQIYRKK